MDWDAECKKLQKEYPEENIDWWMTLHPFGPFPRSGFNDAFVEKERKNYNFSPNLYARSEIKMVLIRFYNLYFNGTLEAEDNVVTTVFDVIALSRTKNGFIWPANAAVQEGFYPTNKSNSLEIKKIQSTGTFVDSSMNKFYKYVKQILELMDVNNQPSDNENDLLILSGFLALMLLRFATKNLDYISNLFSKKQYSAALITVLNLEASKYFHPPCEKFLLVCSSSLDPRAITSFDKKSISKMFVILCDEYKNAVKSNSVNSKMITEYLLESVLTHTKMYGLGLIQMLEKVCAITHKTWKQIKKETTLDRTKKSWKEIDEFYETQLKEGDEQTCYPWARIIDHNFFVRLATKDHVHLATIFAAVIEKVDGPGIWSSGWNKNSIVIYLYKEFGYELFNKSCSKLQ